MTIGKWSLSYLSLIYTPEQRNLWSCLKNRNKAWFTCIWITFERLTKKRPIFGSRYFIHRWNHCAGSYLSWYKSKQYVSIIIETMNIKSQFPIFNSNPHLVYLDSASSTQKPQYVIDKTSDYISSSYANVWRGSYSLAEKSDDLYFKTKAKLWTLLAASPNEIIFSYNATYCINLLAQSFIQSGFFKAWDEIILSIAEHHANILVRQNIAKTYWLTIQWIGLNNQLQIDLEELKQKTSVKTKLVALTACSNVLGIKNNLSQVRSIIWDTVFFLVDGAQVIPNYQVNAQEVQCDALVFSAHKFLAYTGLGILYLKKTWAKQLNPGLFGWGIVEDVSTQEFSLKQEVEKFEPGTPNMISITSLYYALEFWESIGGYEWRNTYEQELIDHCLDKCQGMSDKLRCINMQANSRIWIFSFVPQTTSKTLNQISDYLNSKNICIRVWWHCAYPLAKHLWLEQGSLRLSLYIYSSKEDIDRFFEALDEYL